MYKKLTLLLILSCSASASQRVVLFFQSYPGIGGAIPVAKVLTMSNFQKATEQVVQAELRSFPVAGMWATYAGYLNASDPFGGKIVFPRKQKNPVFDIVVTQKVEPVVLGARTVHHWQLFPNTPAKAYKIERMKDEDTGLYYWQTSKEELPAGGIVPLRSVLIFANPKDVYIPVGATLTTDNNQLVLPDIYITSKADPAKQTIGVMMIKHFFRLVRPFSKKGSDTSWIWQLVD